VLFVVMINTAKLYVGGRLYEQGELNTQRKTMILLLGGIITTDMWEAQWGELKTECGGNRHT